MKLSRTAIKELTAAYRAVLKHAFIASMGIAIISPAMADDVNLNDKYQDGIVKDGLVVNSGTSTLSTPKIVVSNTSGGAVNVSGSDTVLNLGADTTEQITLTSTKSALQAVGNNSVNMTGENITMNSAASNGISSNAANITLAATGDINIKGKTRAIYGELYKQPSVSEYKIDLNGKNVTLSSMTNNAVIAFDKGVNININATDDVDISTETIGEYAAVHSGQGGNVSITGNDVDITGKLMAVAAMSGGTMDIDGQDIKITANDKAITARGGATVNINKSENTLKMTGNISFDYDAPTSGTPIDANVNVVLAGAKSVWTGNTAIDINAKASKYPDNFDPQKLVVTGMNLTLKDGATWNATKVEEWTKNYVAKNVDMTRVKSYIALNKLTIDGGTVNIADTARGIWVDNADITKAHFTGGHVQFNETATITDSVFTDAVSDKGGAIFNTKNASMNIANTTFAGNKSSDFSGAIHNSGTLTVSGSIFTDNHSKWGGAIYSGTKSDLTIDDSMFSDNYADAIGAVGVYKNAKISNTTFKNNVAKSKEENAEGAGAMFFGAVSHSTVTGSTFENNKSGVNGGAIVTRSALVANNTDAELDITDSVFKDNFAEINGGAIYNSFYHSVANADAMTVSGSTFVNNTANNGGAIYNDGTQDKGGHSAAMHLENVTFTNNIAKITGGAIYNSKDASIELAGENVFSGNRRGSLGNDIYNDGAFTITDGTTTIDGGIVGDGKFTLENGATLNMGATAIQQKTININGIVNADILNAREYGRLLGDVTFGDDAQLNLTVATAGTYKIFGNDNDFAGINAGPLFEVQNNGAAGVVISAKDTDTLASEQGLSTQAATALVAIANAGGAASSASIAAQNALASGNVDYVEAESAKVAPVNKPVVHSVSTSVQNQVLSLAASRMSGGIMGRSGGDFVTTGSGMWAHGLINRSKMNGAFHGDTRGVAFGIDATFNRKYTFGMGYAHDNTDVHAGAQKTDIDSDTLFAYAQYKPNKWFINGAFNYTFADYTDKSDLFGINISSKHNVDSYGVQLLSGYDFVSGVTPSVGARFLHIAQDEYTNGLVNVKASDTNFLTGVVGAKYAFDIVATPELTFSPELRAAATYDFMSDNATATVLVPGAAAYVVDSDRLSRFGGEFGIGMSALYRGITVSLNYDLDLHKDYTSQTGMLKFRYNF